MFEKNEHGIMGHDQIVQLTCSWSLRKYLGEDEKYLKNYK